MRFRHAEEINPKKFNTKKQRVEIIIVFAQKKYSNLLPVDDERVYDSSGRQLGRIDSDRVYNASKSQIGCTDGTRLYTASGSHQPNHPTLSSVQNTPSTTMAAEPPATTTQR